jgi:hypothetical protein
MNISLELNKILQEYTNNVNEEDSITEALQKVIKEVESKEVTIIRVDQLPEALSTKEFIDQLKQQPMVLVEEVATNNLTFGQAIEAAKQGKKVARQGWNGAGMFAYIVPSASYPAQTGVAKEHFGENALVPYRAYWALKTAQEDVATWSPSGSDSLAEDWVVLP